jgi:hypothetical protein
MTLASLVPSAEIALIAEKEWSKVSRRELTELSQACTYRRRPSYDPLIFS